jgi:hypothetical protein
MKAWTKKSDVVVALYFWFSGVAGKVDVFCYEEGFRDPKRTDHPAYKNENEYRLLNQENWDQVTMVSHPLCLHSI